MTRRRIGRRIHNHNQLYYYDGVFGFIRKFTKKKKKKA